jgi:multiple sugar transport system permease protein
MLGAFIMLYPLLWLLASSLKPEQEIFTSVGLIPKQLTFENYIQGWASHSGINFSIFFRNTFILVLFCVLGNIISCSMTAYAFARLELIGKKVLFAILLVSMMLPFHVVLIPRFIMFTRLGWVNTYLPLIVPKFLATEGFFCYMMVQFMRGIPRELDQAAIIDGCGPIQIFIRIMIPLCKSALALVVVLTIIWTWNDFFSQLIYIGNPVLFTVALGLRLFIDGTGVSVFGQLFAMSIISLIPIIVFFFLAQNNLMGGIAIQGIKG